MFDQPGGGILYGFVEGVVGWQGGQLNGCIVAVVVDLYLLTTCFSDISLMFSSICWNLRLPFAITIFQVHCFIITPLSSVHFPHCTILIVLIIPNFDHSLFVSF